MLTCHHLASIYVCGAVSECSSMITSFTVFPVLQGRSTTDLVSDVSAPLTAVFLMAWGMVYTPGPPIEYGCLVSHPDFDGVATLVCPLLGAFDPFISIVCLDNSGISTLLGVDHCFFLISKIHPKQHFHMVSRGPCQVKSYISSKSSHVRTFYPVFCLAPP